MDPLTHHPFHKVFLLGARSVRCYNLHSLLSPATPIHSRNPRRDGPPTLPPTLPGGRVGPLLPLGWIPEPSVPRSRVFFEADHPPRRAAAISPIPARPLFAEFTSTLAGLSTIRARAGPLDACKPLAASLYRRR